MPPGSQDQHHVWVTAGGRIRTAIVFAIIVDHEHDFPLKDVVVVDKTARDTRDILAGLHLLELTLQEGGGGGRARHGDGIAWWLVDGKGRMLSNLMLRVKRKRRCKRERLAGCLQSAIICKVHTETAAVGMGCWDLLMVAARCVPGGGWYAFRRASRRGLALVDRPANGGKRAVELGRAIVCSGSCRSNSLDCLRSMRRWYKQTVVSCNDVWNSISSFNRADLRLSQG